MVQKLGHAGLNDAVVDVIAMSSGIEDSEVNQLAQLV